MTRASSLEAISHPLYFDSIDRYEVNEEEFLEPVREMLTGEWVFSRRTVWFGATPPEGRAKELPIQGWKIHVSCALDNALDVLRAVVPVLDAGDVTFKFALDERILTMMNGKNWGRQGAGKFITIYPVDSEHFVELIAELHEVTQGLEGLYILSDRRYKDSKVLFYRYGGIKQVAVANERGEEVSMLISPDGEQVPDQRQPFFHVPAWTRDPFEEDHVDEEDNFVDEEGRIALKGGRYLVKSVFGFSNSGGVYLADDVESGEEVVVKEARPFVTFVQDAVTLLRKEFRILSRLDETGAGISPRAIDFFQDWEHWFLVQEYIQGTQLTTYSAIHNVTLKTHPSFEDTQQFYADFRTIFVELTRIIKLLHENNIVFSDISPNNVIVLTDPLRVRIIDFEGAVEVGVDKQALLFTPGFAYRDQIYGGEANFESDYFSLGAVMHYFLAPFNQIFAISPRSRFTFLRSVVADIGFPDEVHEMIIALIGNDIEARPKPDQVIEILERDHELRPPSFSSDEASHNAEYEDYVERMCDFCLEVAEYERSDRLFPAYAEIFHTNPLSLTYGACGVAHALDAMGRKVPEKVLDWILQPTSEREKYPPGLYMGLSGMAWVLLDLGRPAPAKRILALSHEHPLVHGAFDLFHGAAGWGMTNLKFFLDLGDELYLDKAIEAGELLLEAAEESEKGLCWKTDDDQIPLGLAHGPSGISIFLLYLSRASGREEFLDAGVRALDYDLASGVETRDGGLSWRRFDDDHAIIYPYWKHGSAGVGTALIRYHSVLDDERYDEYLEKIFLDLDRKYAVFPGLFIGMTGLGETLLDFHRFSGEERFRRAAYRVASGLKLFRVERPEGLAYPGDSLIKICCDLATGSAGVGRFFHRLVHGGPTPLLLDSLLEEPAAPRRERELVTAQGAG